VQPNVDDKPEKRTIEIWALVTDPNGAAGIQLVTAHVFDSTGTKKGTVINLGERTCASLGSATDVSSVRHAAENTGQVPHDKIEAHECDKGAFRVFSGTFLLNNDQPDGKYTVRVTATDETGSGAPLENRFLVQNVVAFKIDVGSVNYGFITPGVKKEVLGDFTYGNTRPTIQNTGNSKACLSVTYGAMEGKVSQALITTFDASLWSGSPAVEEERLFDAGVSQQFSTPLQPKALLQMDFSIRPPVPLPSDLYQGRVDLSVKKAGQVGGVAGGPPATGCGGTQ
jgi:hypothetical protein